ncbi:unnamed protein product [Linum tenue]|uniref:PCI domain-containing protein n=1 Tax=Linum tenue TaxID=586396 RepID=A0AAV0Q4R6_9ROSI|nr:unnamed protein product [Linum tenue]
MEIEERQEQFIHQFVAQASAIDGGPASSPSLARLVVESTSHPSVFSFGEILALPNLVQVQGTENLAYVDLLKLFAYGTWKDYKGKSSVLPQLKPDQILKLKQLTVLTVAENSKVVSYDTLLEQLEFSNVRELEDFLIDECLYAGIIKGKLDQSRRCFQIEFAAGRDLVPGELEAVIETARNWLATSDNLLPLIEDKIRQANEMDQLEKQHQMDVKENIEKARKNLHSNDHKSQALHRRTLCHPLHQNVKRRSATAAECPVQINFILGLALYWIQLRRLILPDV